MQRNKYFISIEYWLYLCWILVLLIPNWSCSQSRPIQKTTQYSKGDNLEHRDSLALMYAIRHYSKVRWAVLGVRTDMFNLKEEQVIYRIDRAFYSPDHQRSLLWISKKMPNASTIVTYNKEYPLSNRLCPTGGDTVVTMAAFIGTRGPDNIWKLYFFDEQSVQCAQSAAQARPYLEGYFFKRMKKDDATVNKNFLDADYGGKVVTYTKHQAKRGFAANPDSPFIRKQYGYNLQDENFRIKSLIWQKGAKVPGLYLFETRPGAKPGFLDTPIIPPSVPYPDSIRKLFR